MTGQLKPFRLVNSREINQLQTHLANKLQDWNKQHALFALSSSIHNNPDLPELNTSCLVFSNEQQPIALVDQQDLSLIKYCVFGDVSECFNSVGKDLLFSLLSHLFDIPYQEEQSHAPFERSDWFYKGSAAIRLQLSSASQSMNVYVHPQWVLHKITGPVMPLKPKAKLEETLTYQRLQCQVNLTSLSLTLNDLMQLKIGDVIKTDHRLSEPLVLKHQEQIICPVTLGEMNFFKSIQIVSSI